MRKRFGKPTLLLIGYFLGFGFWFEANAIQNCPSLDPSLVQAELEKTQTVPQAMAARRSYSPKLCSLENVEIVSRIEPGGQPFPSYRARIAQFILDRVRRLEIKDFKDSDLRPFEVLISRVTGHLEFGVFYMVETVVLGTTKCWEMIRNLEVITKDSEYYKKHTRWVYDSHRKRVGCDKVF